MMTDRGALDFVKSLLGFDPRDARKAAIDADPMIAYFGACPQCYIEGEILNVEASHFAACRLHRVFWPVGWNLFSCWRDEDEQVWRCNASFLRTCARVKPYRGNKPEAAP